MLPELLLCAGREQYEFGEVAIKVRQTLNLLLVKICRDIRAVCFQGTPFRFGSHCDLLCYSFYLKYEISAGRHIIFTLNLLNGNPIPLQFVFKAVLTWDEARHSVIARLVGFRSSGRIPGQVCHGDYRANNSRHLWVGHRAKDASVDGLRTATDRKRDNNNKLR